VAEKMHENVHLSQNATKTPTASQKVKFSHILRQMHSFVFFCDKMHSFFAKLRQTDTICQFSNPKPTLLADLWYT